MHVCKCTYSFSVYLCMCRLLPVPSVALNGEVQVALNTFDFNMFTPV